MRERRQIYWPRKGIKIAVFHLLLAPIVALLSERVENLLKNT